ncbi:MAG: hypothetical protein CMM60_04680 [Rhodospirillaceae bacterium]|jgi:hypothetical protein|nr:hypothetical protein [Rhodospirillaceae bacterium]|tara:strand:- start:1275 stop:1556 length:282 start_codon:yes stop_codon:yes gene_type:complete
MSTTTEILKNRKANRKRMETEAPDLFAGFNHLLKHFYKRGALDRCTKELMAVAAAAPPTADPAPPQSHPAGHGLFSHLTIDSGPCAPTCSGSP